MDLRIDSNAVYDLLSKPRIQDDQEDEDDWQRTLTEGKKTEVRRRVTLMDAEVPLPFSTANGYFLRRGKNYSAGVNLFLPDDYGAEIELPSRRFWDRLRGKKETFVYTHDFFLDYIREKLSEEMGKRYKPLKDSVQGYILDDNGRLIMSIQRFKAGENEGMNQGGLWFGIGGSGPIRGQFRDQIDFGREVGQLSGLVTRVLNLGLERAIEEGFTKENPQISIRLGPEI